MAEMTEAQKEYNKTFGIGAGNPIKDSKLEAAFKQASDIRKFEIELYWKRAGYFWALIVVAFAGYFSILGSDQAHMPSKFFLSFIVGTIGFVFTFAWYLVNRGSKYWQENWENHLDLLEDEVTGPLYKTRLQRPFEWSLPAILVTAPLPVSVSKINQWVSVFLLCIWLILCAYSIHGPATALQISQNCWIKTGPYLAVGAIGLLFCIFMLGGWSKTHQGKLKPNILAPGVRLPVACPS
jgi:hypothetical protein